MPSVIITESSNNNYIRNQGFPNQSPFPTWNELQDGTKGTKALAGGTHNDLPVGQWNSDPGDPSIQLYKVYQAFGEISLATLPENATITSVSMRTDIDANPAEGLYDAHIYVYDWGSTVGTSDWRTRAQVGAMTRIAVMEDPDTKGVGYEAWVVDQANLKAVLEAALAAGDPTLKYMYVTTDFVSGNASGDNVEEYIEYAEGVTATEFTINYVVANLDLGAVFLILQVDNLGSGGIITDVAPFELPLPAFSAGNNVRLKDDAIERTLGFEDVLVTPAFVPYWLLPWQTSTTYYWFYFGTAQIYRTDGTANLNVTRYTTTPGDDDYTAGTYPRWNGGVLGGVPVANHSNIGNDYPQEWNGANTRFQDMTNWPQGVSTDPDWYAKVIRVFKNFLIAMYIQEDSVVYPTKLRWNNPADPGTVPGEWLPAADNLAGENPMSETTAPLVDCLPLKDVNVVYKEDSVHLMQFVGGNFVFNFRQAFSEFGLLSQRCVKSFFGKHFVVSFNDIVVHDGQTAISVVDKLTRTAIFSTLSADNYENSFVVAYPNRTEMWVCIPINGSGVAYPTVAHIWNWTENAWTIRDLPGCPHIGLGIITESTTGSDFANLNAGTGVGSFDARSGLFDERTFNPTVLQLMGCDAASTLFQKFDSTNEADGSSFEAHVERTDLAINSLKGGEITVDPHTIKFVRRVYLKMKADPGCIVTVKIGGQDYPGATPNWSSYSFDPNADTYISTRVQGKLLAYSVSGSTAHQWKLFSVGFDMDVIGNQ